MELLRRSDEVEIMDSTTLPPEAMLKVLKFLAWVNRTLGGYSVVLDRFQEWSKRWPPKSEWTVLDIGTGLADLPIALIRWAKSRGYSLRVTAIDSNPVVAALARRNAVGVPEIEVVESDLEGFARQGRRFDYVVGSLVLHHIPRDRRAVGIRLCDVMAERGVVFSDLHRSLRAWMGVTVVTGLFGDRVSRPDGRLSVRRAFRVEELHRLATEAGLPYLQVRRHSFFRLSLAGSKEDRSENLLPSAG